LKNWRDVEYYNFAFLIYCIYTSLLIPPPKKGKDFWEIRGGIKYYNSALVI